MGRLICFELQKVWGKRGFRFAFCVLFSVNIFFLWYTNLGNDRTPELASYRMFSADISEKTEKEKEAFVADLKQTIDGVSFVSRILAMQSSDMGAGFAEQERSENPGLFETYYDLYMSGDYLRYTDSLELESIFIREMYEEESKVAGYDGYLASIQEQKESLNGISIFASQDTDDFASRNIQKSADDFRSLSSRGIKWQPSKGVSSAMGNVWTDLLLALLSFLFIGGLITEEKRKGLFYITRGTRYGRGPVILSKLFAFLLHCAVSASLLYGANLLYFGFAAGWWDVTADLQSLAVYMESCLPVSILGFIGLSVATKALVLFAAGSVLIALCIRSGSVTLPYLGGMAFWAVNWALYRFIPAASKMSAVKYGNLFGALRAENIYGTYLNLDLWGYPVSWIALSWLIVAAVTAAGIGLSFLFFETGESLEIRDRARRALFRFRPHASLLRHEGYKIFITNHGLLILLAFCGLIGYNDLGRAYTPTPQERYYQTIMLALEGELTEEKETLMAAEAARFREAFAEIEKIDASAAAGGVDRETGEALKLKWQSVTAFYPEFQRVERQYERIRADGGRFLYDTGYLYLLGVSGGSVLSDFILLTLGIVLAFCPVMSMEYQSGAWALLCATARGKRRVIRSKAAVCALAAALFSALPFIFRWVCISQAFPTHGLLFSARDIPFYQDCPPLVSVAVLVGVKALLQAVTGLILALVVLGLSAWRKNTVQALFFGLLILCVPIILAALGFEAVRDLSLYPLYAWVW